MPVVPTASAEEAHEAVRRRSDDGMATAMTDLYKVVNACDRLDNHERLV